MKKLFISVLAVLCLLCLASCEDDPAKESGTAAFESNSEVETEPTAPSESKDEGETSGEVFWTPFL